jgi:hypothetical protein
VGQGLHAPAGDPPADVALAPHPLSLCSCELALP